MEEHKYTEEQEMVIDSFKKGFCNNINNKIVLYGIGKNTDAILRACKEYNIVGLMDQNSEGKIVYELPVLSCDEVKKIDGVQIVIVARQSVIDIIYKRISSLWAEDGIRIFDFAGNDLTERKNEYRNQDLPYWSINYEMLIEQIDQHDVISFDIFDTLLMRKVLIPTDVFLNVQNELVEWTENGKLSQNLKAFVSRFADLRIQAEQDAGYCCSYEMIYDKLRDISYGEGFEIPEDEFIVIKERELEYEKKILFPRKVIVDAFNYAIRKKKKVYILSDMYLSTTFLSDILKNNGISGYEEIFVSNEIGTLKEDGTAYRHYLDIIGEDEPQKCLHIGDNRRVDGDMAREAGLGTFVIMSAYEMLSNSSMQSILSDMSDLGNRNILGLIISYMFSNPFALEKTKGYVSVDDVSLIGYVFVAPLFYHFSKWIDSVIKDRGIKKILFPSRDGYLFEKLYRLVAINPVESIYFRTSRRTVSVASIRNRVDIDKIAKRNFSGNCKQFMKRRFGIEIEDDNSSNESINEQNIQILIDKYEEKILNNAKTERERYIDYLRKMRIDADDSLLFDFVAGGTVQYNLSKLIEEKLTGIYIATMNLPNDMYSLGTDKIISAMGNISSYGKQTAFSKNYLFLETVLVDGKKSFSYIDADGQEVFEQDSSEIDRDLVDRLHGSILQFATDYRKFFGNNKFDERKLFFTDELFGNLFSDNVVVNSSIKEMFWNDDIYDGIGKYLIWT